MQPHPSADNWIKALLRKTLTTKQDSIFSIASPSHQEADISLLASTIREETEEARKTILQNVNHDEKAESYVLGEGTR